MKRFWLMGQNHGISMASTTNVELEQLMVARKQGQRERGLNLEKREVELLL